MPATAGRTMLLLGLLLVTTQLLLLGGGQLGLVPDATVLEAYQRALPPGKDPVVDATAQIERNSPILLITHHLFLHQAIGSLLGLLVGAAAALYFSWRRRATWWLLPLLLFGTFSTGALGLHQQLSVILLGLLHQEFGALALRWLLVATGGTLVGGALLTLLAANRVARSSSGR